MALAQELIFKSKGQKPGTSEAGSDVYIEPPGFPDINSDGIVNQDDVNAVHQFFQTTGSHLGSTISSEENETTMALSTFTMTGGTTINDWYDWMGIDIADTQIVTPGVDVEEAAVNLGISTGATARREELQSMLQSYTGRTSLIQQAQRKKAIYVIDRFDGGLNLNKAPRDLANSEAMQMDCLSPAQIGRLTRLGDFLDSDSYDIGLADAEQENYGLHYFKWSDSVNDDNSLDGGSPTNYLAYDSGDGGVDLWNFDDEGGAAKVDSVIAGSTFNTAFKPVYHNAENRLYVSDASFETSTAVGVPGTFVCGIVDRPNYYPFIHTDGTLKYNIAAGAIEGDDDVNSVLITSQNLYQAAPVAGITGDGNVCVTTHSAGYANNSTTHNGIYINVQFEDITGDDDSTTGWGASSNDDGASPSAGSKFYKFYASYLYDNGSETKLTDVTGNNNTHAEVAAIPNEEVVEAKTTDAGKYQQLGVKQVLIDAVSYYAAAFSRVHGARFYYTETNSDGDPIGNDKYQWAELDFRYGFKLVSEFANWNTFENEDASGTTATATELQYVQVLNAANNDDADIDDAGTLTVKSPPRVFTYYILNLFNQEEIKDDLMWKTSAVGNGIAFIGNIKYEGREYVDTMLYSGAGETDAGSPYPMWGTFPVDSNRIDIPGVAGEITALKWTNNRILQFRKNAMYLIDVTDVLAPKIQGVYQGMGVHGQWAVTETAFGCAWANENGAYSYNAQENKVRSITIGRLDAKDFTFNSTSKVGYDDRDKMLIITNFSQSGSAGYHFAYSFIANAWCTWGANKGHAAFVKSNLAIDHDGYLTGALRSGTSVVVRKWSAIPGATATVNYITKDIDMGKPSLDKRFYTLYISYQGGASQASMTVDFRVNGIEGDDVANGWNNLGTITDYTNPYGTTNTTAWEDSSGSPTTGDPIISTDDGLNSTNTAEQQKLAKIDLRSLSGSFPADYFKFARSIQFRITGTAAITFEINDISLVFKEKRIK